MIINEDWKIEADSLNITLLKRSRVKAKGDKPAHDNWYPHGYYSSVKNALHGLVGFHIKEPELKDLKTVVDKIEELHRSIDSLSLANEKPREL